MEIFYQKRGTGNTCTLIEMSARNNIHIGVLSKTQQHYILDKANELNVKIPAPVVINELSDLNAYGAIYIDDFDCLINKLTNNNIKAVTMSEG